MAKIDIIGKGRGLDTYNDLNSYYDYYNNAIFDGQLPKYRVEWNNRIYATLGRVTYNKKLIELSFKYHSINENNELINTLLHEMIHVYCRELHNTTGHGSLFKSMCNKVNYLTGLNIQTRGGEKDANYVKVTRTRYTHQCDECGAVFTRYKDMSKNYRCGRCKSNISVVKKEKITR